MTENSIEKHSFKITIGVAIVAILFLLSVAFNLGTWKTDAENIHSDLDVRISNLDTSYLLLTKKVDALSTSANARDIQLTEIKTKLVNIEALLVEIKQDIKNK